MNTDKATKKKATKKTATIQASEPIPILSPLGGPSKELIDAAVASIEEGRLDVTDQEIGAALFASHVRGDSRIAQSAKRAALTTDEVALGLAIFGGSK